MLDHSASRTPRPAHRRLVGRSTVLVAVAAFLVALMIPATAGAADGPGDYVGRINGLRASVGVQSLQVDGELTAAAQACAQRMAATNTLSHSPDITSGITQAWLKVGENVGVGPDDATIFAAFVASPHHYANLVDPDFNRVGVGVANGGGRQWTCHRFMQVGGGAPPPASSGGGSTSSGSKSHSNTPAASSAPTTPEATPATVPVGPPAPQPGPPPPADSARVAAVLSALRHLSA